MIALIDYGAGNTASVSNVLKELKTEFVLTKNPDEILKADKVILPGVGEASSAMKNLIELNLVEIIKNLFQPFLGICLGMQLLATRTDEGDVDCLNIIPFDVKKFKSSDIKVPHMGWNNITKVKDDGLISGKIEETYFYFAHSYYVPINKYATSYCEYGIRFASSVRFKNFYGVQFHPEKSARQGVTVIKNFLAL